LILFIFFLLLIRADDDICASLPISDMVKIIRKMKEEEEKRKR
jgi:hypothetical protein